MVGFLLCTVHWVVSWAFLDVQDTVPVLKAHNLQIEGPLLHCSVWSSKLSGMGTQEGHLAFLEE